MVQVLGIRHHGPGSARSVQAALAQLQPDCILVEGPSDAAATAVLPLLAHAEMQPPIALLLYAADEPGRAVFYPFAEFSPEWQALRLGLQNNIEVRFCDLPQSHQLAMRATPEKPDDKPQTADDGLQGVAPTTDEAILQPVLDPLTQLAHAAGYDDGEQWWEHVVEQRKNSLEVFDAIREAMAAVRESGRERHHPNQDPHLEPAREAYMRQALRAAQKDGFDKIAVVCGAWHAPALTDLSDAKGDADLLKPLPKIKVQATWAPWTHGRLTFTSGYGAGIASPGWYAHVWQQRNVDAQEITVRWLARVAALLRNEDLDVSSAHIIEATRLAEALAAMRGRAQPDLRELNEATLSVICGGNALPMQLIARKLIVGGTLGRVPDEAPAVPLLQDLQRKCKRLRLPLEATEQLLELDLRKPNDLDRSRLFHRLNLLGVSWATAERSNSKGTFRETWKLVWQPEFTVAIIEASLWGNTVQVAADACAKARADGQTRATFAVGAGNATAPTLLTLTSLLNTAMLADLPDAVSHIMQRLQAQAAVASDVSHLMEALPPLADVMRYGNVRNTDATMVGHMLDGFVLRICVGLPNACSSLNDDAAKEMLHRMMDVHGAIGLLQHEGQHSQWLVTLRQLSDQQGLHGLLTGRSVRLLRDKNDIANEEAARRLGLALSLANDPAQAAAWLEGFLAGSGQLLLHDEALLGLLDAWVSGLKPEMFTQVLPLVRRTFGTFAAPERRNLGERLREGHVALNTAAAIRTNNANTYPDNFDLAMAEGALPLVLQMLGFAQEAA